MIPGESIPPALWYLGVDVAGANNTWCVGLRRTPSGAELEWGPHKRSLADVVEWARSRRVLAVAIDAQLTASLSDENGFRDCDREMRAHLPAEVVTWVTSFNSLMAVPVRGRMLAEAISPFVGTVVETHPRFALWSVLGEPFDDDVRRYKHRDAPEGATARLAAAWSRSVGVIPPSDIVDEGALDAFVAATVAMLYHREPEGLYWPTSPRGDIRGSGPFVSPMSPRLARSGLSPLE